MNTTHLQLFTLFTPRERTMSGRKEGAAYSKSVGAQMKSAQRRSQGEKDKSRAVGGSKDKDIWRMASAHMSRGKEDSSHPQGAYYEQHLSMDEVIQGNLESEFPRYYIGTLRVNPRKKVEAYIRCAGLEVDIRVDDDKLRNRSLHGDIVAIEMLPKEQWLEFSTMMKGKLGLGDSKTEDIHENVLEESAEEKEAAALLQQRLWQPRQDLIDHFSSLSDSTRTEDRGSSTKVVDPIQEISMREELQPRGKIVCIMEANHQSLQVGNLKMMNNSLPSRGEKMSSSDKGVYFVPTDSRYQNIYIPRIGLPESFTNNPSEGVKQIYLANICEEWPSRSRMPVGDNVRAIGEMGTIASETEALLIQNQCNHSPFSEQVLESLRTKLGEFGVDSENPNGGGWTIPEAEIERRKDLRSTRIFTIDPPNAKDLDDALHITPLSNGTYEIGVHIADVTFFLEEDTHLDFEARKRATSVYLVQKVIPMLPPILCEELCSLNPNVDRLAFSCIWRMNADGTMCNHPPWFGRTVIRSCAKLDYPTAQRMIDGLIPSKPDAGENSDKFLDALPEDIWESARRPGGDHKAWECSNDVCIMNSIAKQRRQVRLNNGSLVLTNKKLTFKLDDNGNPTETTTYTIRESNKLVEEYMLLANYLVAQELIVNFGTGAFIRNHSEPNISGLTELREVAGLLGYTLDTTSAKTIQDSLHYISSTAGPAVMNIISYMLTKPIPEAQYLVAGPEPKAWAHYALAIPYYTHFTSPIRRYADVVVHRLLDISIRAKKDQDLIENEVSDDAIDTYKNIAAQCNEMKKASKNAQTRSDQVYFALYLGDNPIDVSGIVVGVGEKSFTVFVPEYGVEDRLFIDNMSGMSSTWDEEKKTIELYREAGNNNKPKKAGVPNALNFTGKLEIKVLEPVRVRLISRKNPPVAVIMSLIGPDPQGDLV